MRYSSPVLTAFVARCANPASCSACSRLKRCFARASASQDNRASRCASSSGIGYRHRHPPDPPHRLCHQISQLGLQPRPPACPYGRNTAHSGGWHWHGPSSRRARPCPASAHPSRGPAAVLARTAPRSNAWKLVLSRAALAVGHRSGLILSCRVALSPTDYPPAQTIRVVAK
jgi:hypothetical protein